MSDSIRDQLLKLGLKPSPKPEAKPNGPRPQGSGRPQTGPSAHAGKGGPSARPESQNGPRPNGGKPGHSGRPSQAGQPRPHTHPGKPGQRPPQAGPRPPQRTREEMDLARAYALRAQAERAEAEALKKAAEEKARQKKERKERLQRLLDGKALNLPETAAEQPRHFEHRGKIRRVYVDDTQLAAINRGDLGIVQLEARYLIVPRAVAEEVSSFAPDMLAVLLSPGEVEALADVPIDTPLVVSESAAADAAGSDAGAGAAVSGIDVPVVDVSVD